MRKYRLSIQYRNHHDAISVVFDSQIHGTSVSDVIAGLFGLGHIDQYLPEPARSDIVMIKLEEVLERV